MLEHKHDPYRKYLEWLFDKIGGAYYENLLYELWQIPYLPEYDLDMNWAERGLELRQEFYRMSGGMYNVPGFGVKSGVIKQCSILEMLISLSMEAAFRVGDGTRWSDPKDWFHSIIENLGLDKATNSNFDDYRAFIDREMDAIMGHQIDKLGGPYNWFVLERAEVRKIYGSQDIDLSKMDIWHQLLVWIRTKSDVENIFEREEVEVTSEIE